MNRKNGLIALLSGLALTLTAATASAGEGPCAVPCPPAPPPCQVVTKKVMVTQYVPQPYETVQTVYKIEFKEEKFTAFRCVTVPVEQTRNITVCKSVPETRDVVVTRYECVPTVEERVVTRNVMTTQPVQTMVTRCVDKGGHYECREVPCGSSRLFGHHGLCGKRSCDDCGAECPPPTRTVKCYVPNMVTVQVPVTTYRCVCTPVTEKVKVTVNKTVAHKETVKVTTCRTVTEVVPQKCTVNVVKQVPYEATRKIAVCVPVQQKVTLTRMVPVQVEKEITCVVGTGCGEECGRCHSRTRHHCRGHRSHGCAGCGG
jgi:hypothetical protein